MMAGSQANRSFIPFAAMRVAGLTFLTVVGLYAIGAATPHRAEAHHLMCGIAVEQRTQTVSIDPHLAGSGVTRADILLPLHSGMISSSSTTASRFSLSMATTGGKPIS